MDGRRSLKRSCVNTASSNNKRHQKKHVSKSRTVRSIITNEHLLGKFSWITQLVVQQRNQVLRQKKKRDNPEVFYRCPNKTCASAHRTYTVMDLLLEPSSRDENDVFRCLYCKQQDSVTKLYSNTKLVSTK